MARPLSIQTIQGAVARHYNITLHDMIWLRSRKTMRPRHVAMFLARTMTAHSRGQIARCFDDCQQDTVTYAARKVARRMETDATLAGAVMAIRAELEAGMNTATP